MIYTLFLVSLGLVFCALDFLPCLWCLRCDLANVPLTATAGLVVFSSCNLSATIAGTVTFFADAE